MRRRIWIVRAMIMDLRTLERSEVERALIAEVGAVTMT